MPRKTRNTRKKGPTATSAASKKTIAAIAENTEGESLESLLDDFDIQTATLARQSLKQFEKEAKLLLNALPMKSSIPKAILKMELSEFISRGGSFQSVWESLKSDKFEPETVKEAEAKENTPPVSRDEPVLVATGPPDTRKTEDSGGDTQSMFVTPAMSTRSQSVRTKRGETATAKRKPKPLEAVKVQAYSTVSGSPVDEKTLLQLHSDELLVGIQDQIMEATAKFPQKWRSKLVQSFRQIKAHAALQDDVLVTPAVRR